MPPSLDPPPPPFPKGRKTRRALSMCRKTKGGFFIPRAQAWKTKSYPSAMPQPDISVLSAAPAAADGGQWSPLTSSFSRTRGARLVAAAAAPAAAAGGGEAAPLLFGGKISLRCFFPCEKEGNGKRRCFLNKREKRKGEEAWPYFPPFSFLLSTCMVCSYAYCAFAGGGGGAGMNFPQVIGKENKQQKKKCDISASHPHSPKGGRRKRHRQHIFSPEKKPLRKRPFLRIPGEIPSR